MRTMKATLENKHCGGGKEAKHNDRSFPIEKADNIGDIRQDQTWIFPDGEKPRRMHNPAKNAARCCRYCFPPEIQKAMDPVMRPTAHMEHLVFPLLVSQGRQMDQAGGDSHRIHLPHQGADPFFIPEDIGETGELAAYIVVGDAEAPV